MKTQLYRIEKKELIEQDRINTLIGKDEEEDEESGQQDAVSPPSTPSIPPKKLDSSAKEDKKADKKEKDLAKEEKKEKAKKKGPKRDLPESAKAKIVNTAALRAAGGTVKSWMLPPSATPSAAPAKPTRLTTTDGITTGSTGMRAARVKGNKRIVLKDALFVMENTRSLRRSPVIYKWYANIK